MSPLQKQVLVRYSATFLVATAILTAAIIAYDVSHRLRDEGLAAPQMVGVLPFLIPAVGRTAMQGATLLAVCLVFGRMAAKNELLALRASGISLVEVIGPILALSVPMSLACVWLGDLADTWGTNGLRRGVCEATVEIAYNRLQSQRSFAISDYKLTVANVAGRTLIQPTITRTTADPKDCVEIKAEIGHLELDRQAANLLVVLENGTTDWGEIGRLSFADRFVQVVPLTWKQSFATSRARIREQEARVAELAAALRSEGQDAVGHGANLISQAVSNDSHSVRLVTAELPAEQASRTKVSRPAGSSREELEDALREEQVELFWRRSLWHQKWANSFCCLAFTLVGIPVAISLRRADPLGSFFICFLPVLLIYQPLQYFGMAYATRGLISPIWLHLNNLLMASFGIWRLSATLRRH